MSPEERQELVKLLRERNPWPSWPFELFDAAADEIERLAKELEHWKLQASRPYIIIERLSDD